MDKIYHRKLIRDKIPEIIEKDGGQYKLRQMELPEYLRKLEKKLSEELKELMAADTEHWGEEAADVLEILQALAEAKGLDYQSIQQIQVEKREKRGGFSQKLFLIWSAYGRKS